MSDSINIASEVRKFIADKIASGAVIRVGWLTHEILKTKSAIEGADEPFYRIAAYAHVTDVVRRCIGKFDAAPTTNEQLTLEGFEHLQIAYTVQRAGEVVLVPVNQLTDSELETRAAEYDQMARGCRAHAREIRTYIKTRASLAEAS